MKKQEIHIPYKYKVLELFGGIGAPRVALDNLFGDCKIKSIDYVDILNWACYAYSKIAKTCYLPQDIKKWNIDVDILVHGSPCQDFSNAGKNLGGDKNSNTRSSLLWETLEIIKNRLTKYPKVIIWENVKGVLNKRHRPIFDDYLSELKKIGYDNRWNVLNGIDFGIPQRRERVFVVSIHKNSLKEFGHFDFNNLIKIPTEKLSNFLEKDVPIEYFISQKSMVKAIENGKIKIIDNVVQTITTKQMRWNNAGVIMVPLTSFTQENQIHNINSFLTTIGAGGAGKRKKIAIPIFPTKSFNNFATFPRSKDGELINGSYNRVWKHDKSIGTISASNPIKISIPIEKYKFDKHGKPLPIFIIDDLPYYLRIITERESWRLMGFRDEHYDAIKKIPKTAQSLLAGNSIIVQVMEAIFKELLWNAQKK